MKPSWELWQENTLLGTLTFENIDQPSFLCHFEPTEAFEQYRPLFDEELRLLNDENEKISVWEKAYDAVDALRLHLHSLDKGYIIKEFILYIEGDKAWFRY